MLAALLIFLYRIEAKVAFFAGIVKAVKVGAQLHAVMAARAFYLVLHELLLLAFFFLCRYGACSHHLFCFQFRFHKKR